MAGQRYFETTTNDDVHYRPGRTRALLAKRRAQKEAREQRDADIKQRTAKKLRTAISTLEREVAHLDGSISSELELARVRDPSHFGYPISVRTMTTRRDNLKATISLLSDRLTLTDVVLNSLRVPIRFTIG
jgi:hypothetical protein